MKALSSGASGRRTGRRFSKPQMEKRRRERINHNLETLRLLMLENTDYMNLKNPKVEKAEILESVIHFLKMGKEMKDREANELPTPTRLSQEAYDEGRRSCLLRIRDFISSKSRTLMEPSEESALQASPPPPQPQIHHRHIYGAQMHTPVRDSTLSPPHWLQQHTIAHPHLTATHTQELFSPLSPNIGAPVWRPWPQG
eukprot:XP_003970151.1 PREDICTED: transcription factor HES-7.1-B-like [Takifugu rubripes]